MTTIDKLSPSPDHTNFSVGSTVFERFEILDEIAAGGQGRVYKARDLMLDTTVALKVLLNTSGTEKAIMRFQQEARLASKMKHPAIATIYNFGVYENTPFLAMEFVTGESLHSILEREQTLPILDFLEVFLHVCDAIQHAHSAGIIHRDIKPGNILVSKSEDGTTSAKVLDFGVAKTLDVVQESAGRLTPTGNLVGSPNYMSPEQAQGHSLTPRTDNYSIGCVMWTALTGEPPFVRENAMETLQCHANAELPKLSTIVGDNIPLQLTAMIDELLSKKPEARPDLKTEVIPLLAECLDSCIAEIQEKARAQQESDTTDSAPIAVTPRLKEKVWIGIFSVIGFLLLVWLILFLIDRHAEKLEKPSHVGFGMGMEVGSDKQLEDLQDETAEELIELVRQGKKHSLTFSINYKREYLLKCVGLPELQRLDITSADLFDDDLQHIAGIPNLEYLSLNRTQVKNLEGLEKLRKLTGLELKDLKIDNESLRTVGKVKTLEYLNLLHTDIDDEGVQHLTDLRNLKKLDLSGTKITADAAQYIKQLTNLQSLSVNNTAITEAALIDILSLPSLQSIYFKDCNSINPKSLQKMRLDFPSVGFNQEVSILRFLELKAINEQKSNNHHAASFYLGQAVDFLTKRFGSDSPRVADFSARLAIELAALGKRSEAFRCLQNASRYAERHNDKSLLLSILNAKLSCDEYLKTADSPESLATEQRALKLEQAIYGPTAEQVTVRIFRMVDKIFRMKNFSKALQLVESNDAFQSGLKSKKPEIFLLANFQYAECLRYSEKYAPAIVRYKFMIDKLETFESGKSLTYSQELMLMHSYLGMADSLFRSDKRSEAIKFSDKAVKGLGRHYDIGIDFKISTYNQRVQIFDALGRRREAAKARESLLKFKAQKKSSAE